MANVRMAQGGRPRLIIEAPKTLPGYQRSRLKGLGAQQRQNGDLTLPCSLPIGRAVKRLAPAAHWSQEATNTMKQYVALENLLNASLKATEPGDGLDDLYGFQRAGVRFGRTAGSYLLADQPGLGKTVQAIEVARFRFGLRLVVCPKVAMNGVWRPEIERWAPGDEILVLDGNVEGTKNLTEARRAQLGDWGISSGRVRDGWVICSPEGLRQVQDLAAKVHFDYVIVDEAHNYLTKTAKPTKIQLAIRSLNVGHKIALTGTPIRTQPHRLWGILNWLNPQEFSSYWRFVGMYWDVTPDWEIGDFLPNGEKALARDLQPIMLRRTKAEVAPQLPAKRYGGWNLIPGDDQSPHGVWLPLEGAHKEQYEAFERDGSLDFGDEGVLIADGHMAEYTRKRQLAMGVWDMAGETLRPTTDSPKLSWLLEHAAEVTEGGGKLVIASHSTACLYAWFWTLASIVGKKNTHLLTGKTPDKARQLMRERFQYLDEPQIFALNVKAGGVALTLDAADDLVLLDESTVPAETEQVEDRIHRISRVHNVIVHVLRTLGTQDEEIAWVAASRYDVEKYLLDGYRGVESAKQTYLATKNQGETTQ